MEPTRYFAWNLTKDPEEFALVANEIITKGHLHQGWGLTGMDIRNPYPSFEQAWLQAGWPACEARDRYTQLQRMLRITPGDIIVVKNFMIGRTDRIPWSFTICECTAPYDFQNLIGSRQDYGHFIQVKTLCSYDEFGSDSQLGNNFRALRECVIPIISTKLIGAIDILKDNEKLAKTILSWV